MEEIQLNEIGIIAYAMKKKYKLLGIEGSMFTFQGDMNYDQLQIEFVNSGLDEYHGYIKKTLAMRKSNQS